MKRVSACILAASVAWAAAALMPSPAGAQQTPHWEYAGHDGPDRWGSLSPAFASCSKGVQQSPIDIPALAVLSAGSITFDYRPGGLNVVNNGHTIQVNHETGSSIQLDGIRHELLQLHFHSPSEHAISGKREPMEMHLVHRNDRGALAVVGVMLREGSATHAYDAILHNLPRSAGDSISLPHVLIAPGELLPGDRAHWRYDGSLTTPPCSEGVSWVVLKTTVELSREQMEAFHAIVHDNARPVQPVGARVIGAVPPTRATPEK